MLYPVVIHKDPKSCYAVTVLDLPGCFTAGDTFADALTQAKASSQRKGFTWLLF